MIGECDNGDFDFFDIVIYWGEDWVYKRRDNKRDYFFK